MALILPWSNALTTILLVPLAFYFMKGVLRKGFNYNNLIFILSIGGIFLVNFIFGFFNDNLEGHLSAILRQAPLLAIPIFILGTREPKPRPKQFLNKLLLVFAFSVIIMACCNYVGAFIKVFSVENKFLDNFGAIRYDILSRGLINHQQLYFGLYLSFALNILFYYFFSSSKPKQIKRIIVGIAFVIGFYFLVILSVRMTLAATTVALVIQVFSLKHSIVMKSITVSVITLVLVIAYQYNTTLQKRINYLTQFSLEYNYNEDWAYEGLALRFMNWECSLNVALDNFYTGVGISNVQEHLDSCYLENKFGSILFFTRTNGNPFNSHNFYLQTFVASGFLGLIICIAITIGLLYHSIKKRNELFFIFLILFFMQGLTESLLYREKGIYFFAIFCSVFLWKQNTIFDNHKEIKRLE